jgi:hypothetical protein
MLKLALFNSFVDNSRPLWVNWRDGTTSLMAHLISIPSTPSRSSLSPVNPTLAELQHAILRRLLERIHTSKALINDMLRWPELYALEAINWKVAYDALEKAEVELSHL